MSDEQGLQDVMVALTTILLNTVKSVEIGIMNPLRLMQKHDPLSILQFHSIYISSEYDHIKIAVNLTVINKEQKCLYRLAQRESLYLLDPKKC